MARRLRSLLETFVALVVQSGPGGGGEFKRLFAIQASQHKGQQQVRQVTARSKSAPKPLHWHSVQRRHRLRLRFRLERRQPRITIAVAHISDDEVDAVDLDDCWVVVATRIVKAKETFLLLWPALMPMQGPRQARFPCRAAASLTSASASAANSWPSAPCLRRNAPRRPLGEHGSAQPDSLALRRRCLRLLRIVSSQHIVRRRDVKPGPAAWTLWTRYRCSYSCLPGFTSMGFVPGWARSPFGPFC